MDPFWVGWFGVDIHAPGGAGVRKGRVLARDREGIGVSSPFPASASGFEYRSGSELARDRCVDDDDTGSVGVNSDDELGGGDDSLGACLGGIGVKAHAPGGFGVFMAVKFGLARISSSTRMGVTSASRVSASSSEDEGRAERLERSCGGDGVRKSRIEVLDERRRGGVVSTKVGMASEEDPSCGEGPADGGVPGGV